ncbi:MAG: lectin-like protein, partial [Planctomycetota bacterium]
MTWPDAKAFCERQGGHLVTITSKEESDFVVDLTRRVNGRYWIGFTDGRVEGTWEWVTGEPVKFTAWAEGQPNSMDGDQDYGIINGSEYDSLWDDNGDHNVRARGGNGFVCEWEPAPAPGNVASDITGSCLVNADMSSGGAVPTGWKMAKDAAPNARLVRDTTVFSKGPASLKLDCPRRADKATVMQHFKLVPRGRFSVSGHVRAAGGPDLFQVALWASDAEWKELAWILLGTASGGRDWTALSKDVELPPGVVNVDLLVTCKGPGAVWLDEVRVGPPRVAWDRSSRQPYRTAALGGRRYGVYPTWTTWREAKAFCERVGGHLVTITSVEENAVVAGLAAAAGAEVWIGFSDERQEGTWEWITGEGAAYTNWRGGEPNNAQGAEDCATLGQMPGGQWRDAKADAWGAGGFVCEWEAGAKAMKTPAGVGADLTRGLVGHWKFDDGEGTVARDSSGKRCDGQIKGGAKWAEGRTGGALEFDGRDDYVLIAGQDLATSGDYSLAAWSKLTSWNGWRVLVAKGYAGMTHHPDSKVFGAWHAHVDDPEHVKYFRGQRVENPGRWHHVAMTVDTGAAEVRLYVDGTMHQIASYGKPGDGGFSWASPWTIGARVPGRPPMKAHYFHGRIDDVRIYERALSAEEIMLLAHPEEWAKAGPAASPGDKALDALLTGFDSLMAKGDHAGARRAAEAEVTKPANAPQADTLRAAARIARALEERPSAIRRGARSMVGRDVRLKLRTGAASGKLREVTEAHLVLATTYTINRQKRERSTQVAWSGL